MWNAEPNYKSCITEGLGLEGTIKDHPVPPPAMGRDPFPQPRVLRAPSSLALNPAREGAAIAPLGSLDQGPTTLRGKSFFLTADLNLPVFTLKPFPLVLSLQALVNSPLQLSHRPLQPLAGCSSPG